MQPATQPQVPAGYTVLHGPDAQKYLVPDFMVPVTQQAMDADQNRRESQADKAAGGPNKVSEAPYFELAEGDVLMPADPVLSDREALRLHSEVKALQDRLGLSYKDAAHRLYISEVEKLRTEKHAARAMKSIRTRIDNTIVERIFPPISQLDGEEVSGEVEGAETVEGARPN